MAMPLVWSMALAVATFGMFAVRPYLGQAHIALVFLLIVLGGSAAGGRGLGLWLAGISFLIFDYFFLPPYGTLAIENPLDWLVLIAYLITSIVAAQLLYRAQRQARIAQERASEVNRLAAVGAQALNAGRSEDALRAIAAVIRDTTGAAHCEIFVHPDLAAPPRLGARADAAPPPSSTSGSERSRDALVEWVAERGAAVLEQRDGTTRLGSARPKPEEMLLLESGQTLAVSLPLQVQGRTAGVLRLADDEGIHLDAERWRFLDAISYYAALGVERVRLSAEAEHAEALREADRLKSALLASVSHDLRTPLTAIRALAHDLSEYGDERTEIIEQEADRLNSVVADLLDLSRLTAGALPVRAEPNAVDDLLGALVQQAEPGFGGDRLRASLPPGAPLMLGRFDFVHSLRILSNLVGNAVKYAPGDSPIEITVSEEGGMLAIHVADRGPGVPPEAIERIFEPFYRPPGAPPDVGSAGLGLSIARQLAEVQGGRLMYEPRPGGGSVFTLLLPTMRDGTAGEAEPPESS
jgi:two-component system sensor histidine kinase KdpD